MAKSWQILIATLILTATYFTFRQNFNLSEQKNSYNLISSNAQYYSKFQQWMQNYAKSYLQQEQKLFRFKVFVENAKFVEAHNQRYKAGDQTFSVTLNQFADMPNNQFKQIYTRVPQFNLGNTSSCVGTLVINTTVPSSKDWTTQQKVSSVKNQGQCMADWAISASQALEGLNAIQNKKLEELSAQQLIDCSSSYKNNGCKGGSMDYAFQYVIDNGIALTSKIPYTGVVKACTYKNNKTSNHFQIKSCAEVQPNNTRALLSAVHTQPVSVWVNADSLQFQLYNSGVFSGKCGLESTHSMTLVGYGTYDGNLHWKCKNNWGANWGMSGYILLGREQHRQGIVDGPGQCGILIKNYVPLMK